MKIIFLCVGNTCRSPFAEHYARIQNQSVARPHTFTSRGIQARNGMFCSDMGRTVAAELGIDLSAHRAQQLSLEDIQTADLLLCVDDNVREQTLLMEGCMAAPKCHLLSNTDIADPWGGTEADYRAVYRHIMQAVALWQDIRFEH